MKQFIQTYITMAAILVSVLGGFPGPEAFGNAIAENTQAYAELIKAQATYVVAMAEANLKNAQAELFLAQAAHEWERVRQLRLLVNRLELELKRARKQEHAVEAQIKKVTEHARRINLLKMGRSSKYVHASLFFILTQVVPSAVVGDTLGRDVGSFQARDFVPNKKDREAVAFEGGNVGQLLEFIKANDFSFSPFSPAHLEVVEAMEAIEAAADEETAKLNTFIQELMNRKFEPVQEPVAQPPQTQLPPQPPRIS